MGNEDFMPQQDPGVLPTPLGAMSPGVLPSTNPVQASTNPMAGPTAGQMAPSPLDPQQIGAEAMQTGTRLTQSQLDLTNKRSQDAINQAMAPYSTPDPKYGFTPHFDPVTGPVSFLKDIGQALLTVGASTRPGQAIQNTLYGPAQRARAAEIATREAQVGALEKGAEEAGQPIGAVSRMGPAYMNAESRQVTADAALKNANTRAEAVMYRHNQALQQISQGWAKLDQSRQRLALDTWAKKAQIDVQRERINAGMAENDARVAATRDVATALQSNKIVAESPIMSQVLQGLGWAPDIQLPGGTTETSKPGQSNQPDPNAHPGYTFRDGPKGRGYYKNK